MQQEEIFHNLVQLYDTQKQYCNKEQKKRWNER